MHQLLPAFLLLLSSPAFCQEYDSDLGKGKINKDVCLRWEAGWNRSLFTSLGLSYVYSNINSHMPTSFVFYVAGEANYAQYRPQGGFYAYKAGIESGNILAYGVEVRTNTDFAGNNHVVLTPKLGLSVFGYINLLYGYNIFQTKNNVFDIYHNQLTFSINLNRRLLKESIVPKE